MGMCVNRHACHVAAAPCLLAACAPAHALRCVSIGMHALWQAHTALETPPLPLARAGWASAPYFFCVEMRRFASVKAGVMRSQLLAGALLLCSLSASEGMLGSEFRLAVGGRFQPRAAYRPRHCTDIASRTRAPSGSTCIASYSRSRHMSRPCSKTMDT